MEGNERPNERPRINLRYLNYTRNDKFSLPPNSNRNQGNTRNSRRGYAHFKNAKAAARAENGLKLAARARLGLGTKGVLEEYDGPRTKVEVIRDIHVTPYDVEEYTFRSENGKVFTKEERDRFSTWDFYNFIEPVPFVPRGRVERKSRKSRKSRKTRKSRKVQRK
jgi:hypothetical protein